MRKIIFYIVLFNVSLMVFSQEYFYKNLNAGKIMPDVSKYQSIKPEEIIYKIPENIITGLSTSLEEYSPKNGYSVKVEKHFEKLINFLISWTDDDYLKIKSIHDWICFNIIYDLHTSLFHNNSYQSVLKYKNAVCQGYSVLFKEMVEKAGFEAHFIEGFASGGGIRLIPPEEEINNFKMSDLFEFHAWNIVKINDLYYHIDVTFDYGLFVNNDYCSKYFLINPDIFIDDHYPKDPKWLLTDYYVSERDFMRGKSNKTYGISGKWIAAETIEEKNSILKQYPDEIDKNKYLAIASSNADYEITRLLIQHKADVNYIYKIEGEGIGLIRTIRNTPLELALNNDHLEIVKLLVENGAKFVTKDPLTDSQLDDVTSLAFQKNNLEIFNYFRHRIGFIKGWPTDSIFQLYGFSLNEPVLSYGLNTLYKIYKNNVLCIFLHNANNLIQGINSVDFNNLSFQLISQIIDKPYPILRNDYWAIFLIDPINNETQEFQYVIKFKVEQISSGIRIVLSREKLDRWQQEQIDNDRLNLFIKRYKLKI